MLKQQLRWRKVSLRGADKETLGVKKFVGWWCPEQFLWPKAKGSTTHVWKPKLHSCIVCSLGSMEDLGALVALKVLSAAGSRRLCVTPHYRLAAVSSLARTRLGPTSSATNNPKCLSGCSLHCLGYNKAWSCTWWQVWWDMRDAATSLMARAMGNGNAADLGWISNMGRCLL